MSEAYNNFTHEKKKKMKKNKCAIFMAQNPADIGACTEHLVKKKNK